MRILRFLKVLLQESYGGILLLVFLFGGFTYPVLETAGIESKIAQYVHYTLVILSLAGLLFLVVFVILWGISEAVVQAWKKSKKK